MKNIVSSVLFLCALSTLLFLGFWQIERLQWKQGIIAQLNAEYMKDPQQNQYQFEKLSKLHSKDIKYGQVQGRFNYSKQMLFGPKPLNGEIGYWVITPLKINNDQGHVFVHRGWVKESHKNGIKQSGQSKTIIASGVFRKSDWNKFTPNNNVEANVWTKLDLEQMAEAQGIQNIAPVLLYAENISNSSKQLILQESKWYPRNKHKQYAVFWFAMAGVFIGVFGLFVWNKKHSLRNKDF